MKKYLVKIVLVAMFLVMANGSVCYAKAYGSWCMTLYNRYCSGSTWEKWGCKGYLHYRLDWNRKRDGAHRACKNSCNKQTPNATAKNACLKGCQNARGQEK